MNPRSAMKYIRSITSRPEPEQFPTIPDPVDFDAAQKREKCYLPTPAEITAKCLEIRAAKGESAEIQAAIAELVEDEWDDV